MLFSAIPVVFGRCFRAAALLPQTIREFSDLLPARTRRRLRAPFLTVQIRSVGMFLGLAGALMGGQMVFLSAMFRAGL